MPVNGKSKGSTFERKIANLLSVRFETVTGLKQGFRRNTDSGSFFGGSNQRRVATHDLDHANFGDLICPNNFNYSVECKFYKTGPTFASIVKGKVTQWDDWLAQATQDASNSQKEMMLIIKYNGIDEIVFVNKQVASLALVVPYKGATSIVYGYKLDDYLTLSDNVFFMANPETISEKSIPNALSVCNI
jgi:hypothetical protein